MQDLPECRCAHKYYKARQALLETFAFNKMSSYMRYILPDSYSARESAKETFFPGILQKIGFYICYIKKKIGVKKNMRL